MPVFSHRSQTRELPGRLRLENLVALGEHDPGLPAAGPEMHGRAQPGSIVEGAGPHTVQAVIRTRRAANPTATLWAYPPGLYPPAVGGALDASRLDPAETKAGL